MLKNILVVFLAVFLNLPAYSQVINFSDSELKHFLINEICVDTAHNGVAFSNHISVDRNGDNEIHQDEALLVEYLELKDFSDQYSIKSLLDLNVFSNLEYLKVIDVDSIAEISNLELGNLKTLWISSVLTLRKVDISNLPGLTKDLRIEGIDTLDYLNIKNGNLAQYFSLFYSEHIHFACVDSIAAEYDEVAWRMISGLPETGNCETSTATLTPDRGVEIRIFPNPGNGIFEISTPGHIGAISIFDSKGVLVRSQAVYDARIDLSGLGSGIYILVFEVNGKPVRKKIVKF